MTLYTLPPDRVEYLRRKLLSHVDLTPTCWNWTASLGTRGYGNSPFKIRGVRYTVSAHRVSWMVHCGAIPNGLHVLHRCDNRRCVNPDHLFLGTHKDNMADMVAKGRTAVFNAPAGEASPHAKLTGQEVAAAFDMRLRGLSYNCIAREFGLTKGRVADIMRGRCWTSVTGLPAIRRKVAPLHGRSRPGPSSQTA